MVGEPQTFQPHVLHLTREVRKETLTTHMFSLCKFFFYCLFGSDRRMPDPGESSAFLPPCPSMPRTQAGRARSQGLALWPIHVSMFLSDTGIYVTSSSSALLFPALPSHHGL